MFCFKETQTNNELRGQYASSEVLVRWSKTFQTTISVTCQVNNQVQHYVCVPGEECLKMCAVIPHI